MKRRRFLGAGASVMTVGTATPAIATATASRTATATSNVLTERVGLRYDNSEKRFVYIYEYDIPDNLTELTIKNRALDRSTVSVVETRGVSRDNPTSFVWSGGRSPRLVIESRIAKSTLSDDGRRGYAGDSVAFGALLKTAIRYRYRGTGPRLRRTTALDGDGYVGEQLVYAGPVETRTRSEAGTETTFVTPEMIDVSIPYEDLRAAYAFANDTITPQTRYDRRTVFLLPSEWGGPSGFAKGNDAVLHADVAAVTSIGSVALHEHVHTMFDDFGTGDMYWLGEAVAEYYGGLVALNLGAGTFSEFLQFMNTNSFRNAVLTDSATMQRTYADYLKGAHVLAALEAEIQRVSDGAATLNDVFSATDYDLTTYAGFEDAVVDASGAPSLASWLDRYVRSEALPEIPRQPRFFTLGDRSPADLQSSQSAATGTIGPWQTTIENDASVEGTETDLAFRVYKCSSVAATRSIPEGDATVAFDYEIEAEQWWERPYMQILEDGALIWEGSVGSSELYDDRIFDISAGGRTRGRVEKPVSGTGPLQVRLGITPSGVCSASDHGTTWFRVSNFTIRSDADGQLAVETHSDDMNTEPTPSTAATESPSIEADTPTPAVESVSFPSASPTEAEGPGFGIPSAVGGLAGLGFLRSRWADDE